MSEQVDLKLYGYWRSSASYRVRIALNLKALPYEYVPISLVADGGQHKTAEYQNINPSMLVPTFVDTDKDITLYQSLAIIEYLDEKYASGTQLVPKHTLDRARVRMYAQDIACDVQPLANSGVIKKSQTLFNANDEQTAAWSRYWISKGFTALSKKLAGRSGEYCYGYNITLVDVCLVPQVYNAERLGINMDEFPLLQKINRNCLTLDAFKDASPERQVDAK